MWPVHKADNLPPSCAVVTKSGNLNFLEPSVPLQACDGTAFFYWRIQHLKEASSLKLLKICRKQDLMYRIKRWNLKECDEANENYTGGK